MPVRDINVSCESEKWLVVEVSSDEKESKENNPVTTQKNPSRNLNVGDNKALPEDSVKDFQVTSKDILQFAQWILGFIGLFILFGAGAWLKTESDIAKEIFDVGKNTFFPIATIIVGYYFGRSDDK